MQREYTISDASSLLNWYITALDINSTKEPSVAGLESLQAPSVGRTLEIQTNKRAETYQTAKKPKLEDKLLHLLWHKKCS